MINAFLEALPIALGIVLATLPLVGVSLLLVSRSDQGPALTFVVGWGIGAVLLGGIAILLSDLSTPGEQPPAAWVIWIRLGLGSGLALLATRKLMKRKSDTEEPGLPGWMQMFDTMTPGAAFATGAGLVILNPKNAVLFASGALTIAAETYAPLAQLAAMLLFTLLASSGLLAPMVLKKALGMSAEPLLASLKTFLARRGTLVVAVVLLVLGVIVVLGALDDLGRYR
ncbi:MAG: hypothetical protein GJ676_02650 [Rhodobacteraceae bacterium]|nr:hypothetical protein [Paracoccaceae bacterium]